MTPRGEIRLPVACPKTPVHDAHTKTNNGRVWRAFVRRPKTDRRREEVHVAAKLPKPISGRVIRVPGKRRTGNVCRVKTYIDFLDFSVSISAIHGPLSSGRWGLVDFGSDVMRFKIRLLNYFAVIWPFSSHLNVRSAITKSIAIVVHDCRILSFRTVPTRKSFLKITPTRAINT